MIARHIFNMVAVASVDRGFEITLLRLIKVFSLAACVAVAYGTPVKADYAFSSSTNFIGAEFNFNSPDLCGSSGLVTSFRTEIAVGNADSYVDDSLYGNNLFFPVECGQRLDVFGQPDPYRHFANLLALSQAASPFGFAQNISGLFYEVELYNFALEASSFDVSFRFDSNVDAVADGDSASSFAKGLVRASVLYEQGDPLEFTFANLSVQNDDSSDASDTRLASILVPAASRSRLILELKAETQA